MRKQKALGSTREAVPTDFGDPALLLSLPFLVPLRPGSTQCLASEMPPSAGAQRDEESGDGSTAGPAQNPDGASGTAQAATATTQTRVLTPATIRLDSKVLFAHTSALW